MTVERLLEELSAVEPEQVAHWRSWLAVSRPELKAMLEREVRGRHAAVFGRSGRWLLTRPPAATIRGRFMLGTVVYERQLWPAGLRDGELLQHVAIYGRSGSGKTNAAFGLLRQVSAARVPFVLLDWKRNGRDLLPYLGGVRIFTPGRQTVPFPFNPFMVPPGIEPKVYANHVVGLLADVFVLGVGARSVLQRVLASTYVEGDHNPSAASLLVRIEALDGPPRLHGWKVAAVRALETLQLTELDGRTVPDQAAFVRDLLSDGTILELDGLPTEGRRFLVPLLCFWLYSTLLATAPREKLNFVVMVEEAHQLLPVQARRAHEPVLEMLLRQAREVGMGFVLVDQQPSLMSPAAQGNTFASLSLNQKDPRDLRRAAELSGIPEGERHRLSELPVGHGVLKLQDRWTKPVLLEIPHLPLKKGAISEAEIARLFGPGGNAESARSVLARPNHVPHVPPPVAPFDDAMSMVLSDVLQHPESTIRERYRRLGLTARRGTAAVTRLVHEGLLASEVKALGSTRQRRLSLAPRGRAIVKEGTQRSESTAHAYWKDRIAAAFRARDYRVTIEYRRRHGACDVFAKNRTEAVAIEVETGRSDVVHNVEQDLLMAADRVLVAATTPAAQAHAERVLAKAGLLIAGKVVVVACHDLCQ